MTREDVVEEDGWLPRDRREHTWWSYRLDREHRVRDLKAKLPELKDALAASTDRAEHRGHRAELAESTREADRLVAEGPFTGGDVLGVCDPNGAPRVDLDSRASAFGLAGVDDTDTRGQADVGGGGTVPGIRAAVAAGTEAQPIAVIASGLPIAEVVAKLSELQEQYPDAEVWRGPAKRWELWEPEGADDGTPDGATT